MPLTGPAKQCSVRATLAISLHSSVSPKPENILPGVELCVSIMGVAASTMFRDDQHEARLHIQRWCIPRKEAIKRVSQQH